MATPGRQVVYDGDASIDGVPGTAAPIHLAFLGAAGSKTGKLLPTGRPLDRVDGIEISCVDAAMPVVLIRASDLGKTGYETPAEFSADREFMRRLEALRIEAGKLMGIPDAADRVIPKPVLIAPPAKGGTISARYFMPHSCHAALAITGSVAVATAAVTPGTLAHAIVGDHALPVMFGIEHPSGRLEVTLDHHPDYVEPAAYVVRTARRLFEGHVLVKASEIYLASSYGRVRPTPTNKNKKITINPISRERRQMIVTPTAHGGPPKPFYMQLYFQVLFGVILGVTLGHFVPEFAALFKPMGDAFIKIVKMMIVPVVFCTIVIGIATVGGDQSIGRTLLKAMALFYVLTIIALVTGLIAVETIKPGVGMHIAASSIDPSEAARYAKNAKPLDFIDVLLHIIPQSFFTPFAEGEVLPVLFISIITGFGLRRAGKAGQPFLGGLEFILGRTFCSVRFPDEACAIRCFRCNRIHHCQERHQIDWQSRASNS